MPGNKKKKKRKYVFARLRVSRTCVIFSVFAYAKNEVDFRIIIKRRRRHRRPRTGPDGDANRGKVTRRRNIILFEDYCCYYYCYLFFFFSFLASFRLYARRRQRAIRFKKIKIREKKKSPTEPRDVN